jgi:uncharacterized damage-inducible protein DinB
MLKAAPLLGCALVATIAVAPQLRTPNDPLTGTWSGTAAPPDGSRSTTVTVEFRLDSASAITGTITSPDLRAGDITAGSFDARTGVLRFSVVVRGDGARIEFDGALRNDTVRVSAKDGNQGIAMTLTRGTSVAAINAAQPQGGGDAVAAVRAGLAEVNGWIAKSAALVPPDKYAYKPVATVRTFGQLVAHIIDGYNYYCGRAAGGATQWSDASEKGATDKAALATKLKTAQDACTRTYAGTPQIGHAMANIAHSNLHYGNMITYLRMMGLTPPSS